MAAPTQAFPPWLTASSTVITDSAGNPLTTSTTVLFLPLTYYGPSIPLDSDWTYGGLTSPASTPSTVQSTSITTVPENPSTLTSPSATPSAIPSTTPISSFPSTATPTTSPTSPVSPVSLTKTHNKNIAIILGSIFGFLFLVIALLLCFCLRVKRNRRIANSRFRTATPLDQDYEIVAAEDRPPGEGSPRGSGDEADSFLRRSGGSRAGAQQMEEIGYQPRAAGPSHIPRPISGSVSTSSTANSGYGTILDQPTIPSANTNLQMADTRRGNIISPWELHRIGEESSLHGSAETYSQLSPPPRVDPDRAGGRTSTDSHRQSEKSLGSIRSSYPVDADEPATLLTARRVKVEDLGPRSPPQAFTDIPPESPAGPSAWAGGLTSLKRFSWFKSSEPSSSKSSQARSRPSSLIWAPMSDDEVESGRALLSPPIAGTSARSRASLGVGLDPGGERPMSSVSAKSGTSGGTIYHDARSSIPGTPPPPTPPITQPPRALTPSGQGYSPRSSTPSGQEYEGRQTTSANAPPPLPPLPPAYDDVYTSDMPPGPIAFKHAPSIDILDMPVPSAISPFTSSSSLRDTASISTGGTRTIRHPPGLQSNLLPNPSAWLDTSGVTPSPGSFGGTPVLDILEEEPPSAGEGWRSMASAAGHPLEGGRRTTFGLPQYVHPNDSTMSERGSLHSMRSHFSPNSARSTGSAPASRAPSSSLGSWQSAARSGSSGGHSLVRSGSITSDGHRRTGPISPAISAFGNPSVSRSASSASPHRPPLSGGMGAGWGFGHVIPDSAVSETTGTTIDTNTGTVQTGSEPGSPLSPSLHLPNVPWAAGLDTDWTAS